MATFEDTVQLEGEFNNIEELESEQVQEPEAQAEVPFV